MFLLSVAFIATSCSTTITKTATTEKLPAAFLNATVADLDVAPERVYYTMTPSKAIQRSGLYNVKQAAINECLQKNNNADLLVEPEFVIMSKSGFFSGPKVVQITVSGRPAKYKEFRSLPDSVWCNPAFRGYRPIIVGGRSY